MEKTILMSQNAKIALNFIYFSSCSVHLKFMYILENNPCFQESFGGNPGSGVDLQRERGGAPICCCRESHDGALERETWIRKDPGYLKWGRLLLP
jgi:hypothetical protein